MAKIKNWSRVDSKRGLKSVINEELGFRTSAYRIWKHDEGGQYVVVANRSRPRSGSTHKVIWMARNMATGNFYGEEKLNASHRQSDMVDFAVDWMKGHPEGLSPQ